MPSNTTPATIAPAIAADLLATTAAIVAPVDAAPVDAAPVAVKPKRKPRPAAIAKPIAAPVAAIVAPAKPGRKPDLTRQAGEAARVKLINAEKLAASAIYNGPSLGITSSAKPGPIGKFAALLANPKHRTRISDLTIRDGSIAARILANTVSGSFNPTRFNCDAGVFSRLSSVGYIVAAGELFKLTSDGIAFAKRATANAKAA